KGLNVVDAGKAGRGGCSSGPNWAMRVMIRCGAFVLLGRKGIRPQQVSLLKNAAFTPAATAALTLLNISSDQYSSWPTDSQPLARNRLLASACVSTLLM